VTAVSTTSITVTVTYPASASQLPPTTVYLTVVGVSSN
jgi:hypothetical protein